MTTIPADTVMYLPVRVAFDAKIMQGETFVSVEPVGGGARMLVPLSALVQSGISRTEN
jgi:hypothetical protein